MNHIFLKAVLSKQEGFFLKSLMTSLMLLCMFILLSVNTAFSKISILVDYILNSLFQNKF